MRDLHYPGFQVGDDGVLPWHDATIPWYLPRTPPLMAAEERSPTDVEKTVEHIIGDLKGRAIGKGTAERIRDAASGRIKQVESDSSIHRAINRP